MKAALRWLLSHPVLGGVGALAAVAALVLALHPSDEHDPAAVPITPAPPPVTPGPPPCSADVSSFTSESPENEDFERVLTQLDADVGLIYGSCKGSDATTALARLADHYRDQRGAYLRSKRVEIRDDLTETVGKQLMGSDSREGALRADCPDEMVVVEGTFHRTGQGGCSGSEPHAEDTFISGTVSQTGEGTSSCTITAQCRFPEAAVTRMLDAEGIRIRARIGIGG
jgi:hypothetical protein